jgi:hypothetical protein
MFNVRLPRGFAYFVESCALLKYFSSQVARLAEIIRAKNIDTVSQHLSVKLIF